MLKKQKSHSNGATLERDKVRGQVKTGLHFKGYCIMAFLARQLCDFGKVGEVQDG